jgi:hypothetical protein
MSKPSYEIGSDKPKTRNIVSSTNKPAKQVKPSIKPAQTEILAT